MTTSLYIHWPFCESKCPYCDFNSHVREKIEHERWQAAYLKEIDFYAGNFSRHCEAVKPTKQSSYSGSPRLQEQTRDDGKLEIDSIFFGGGTPSLMKPEMVEEILKKVRKEFVVKNDIEITLEANPSSFETEKFKAFKDAGINRVSIGVQSFDENNLKFLGRKHDKKQAIHAIESAGKIFGNYSFDLIYALPSQNIDSWSMELDSALQFGSPHISLYQLTIEKGTPFYSDYNNKKFTLPDEGLQTELYLLTLEKCKEKGLERYEISNFAKPGFESKHNMNYWLQNEYIGIGPGAHGRISMGTNELKNQGTEESNNSRSATMTIHNPENWLTSVEEKGHGIQTTEKLSQKELLEELLFMGLRIREGIKFEKFTTLGSQFTELFDKKLIQKLCDEGLMEVNREYMRLTDKGLLLHTNIVKKLLN